MHGSMPSDRRPEAAAAPPAPAAATSRESRHQKTLQRRRPARTPADVAIPEALAHPVLVQDSRKRAEKASRANLIKNTVFFFEIWASNPQNRSSEACPRFLKQIQ